jgi:ABC-type nitrate/sulfonate/bicarbonate transport system substrate-binding protein
MAESIVRPPAAPHARSKLSGLIRLTVSASSLLLLLACGPQPSPVPATDRPPAARPTVVAVVPVRVGVVGALADAGLFIGVERGYFQKQGLDVTLVPFDNVAAMIPAMGARQIEVGGGSTAPGLFNAVRRDVPLKIVADKGNAAPGFGLVALVVRRDLAERGAIQEFDDLRGRTVAVVGLYQAAHAALVHGLAQAGVPPSAVNVVALPFPDMVSALANGSIDAGLLIEPFVAVAVERGVGVRWKGVDEFYPNYQIAMLLYAPHFASSELRSAAERFMLGYLRGVRDYNDAFILDRGRDSVIDILMQYTPVKNRALYDVMVPAGLRSDGRVNIETIQADQDWYVAAGQQSERVGLETMVDPTYAEQAVRELGLNRRRPGAGEGRTAVPRYPVPNAPALPRER